MTSIAITKITAAIDMCNELFNNFKLKRSAIRPIGNRHQAQHHISYVNESISVWMLLESAIALFVKKIARIKPIKIL
jgi:hypothetical protein